MMITSRAGRSASSEPRRSSPLSFPSRRSTNARSCGRRASESMAADAEPHSVTAQPRDSRQTASVLRMLRSSSTTRTRIARFAVFASSFNAALPAARARRNGGQARGPNSTPSSQRTALRGSRSQGLLVQGSCRKPHARGVAGHACEMQGRTGRPIASCNTGRWERPATARCCSTGNVVHALFGAFAMSTPAQSVPPEPEHRPRPGQRLKRFLLGGPKDLQDPHLFRHISLIAFLAWVGLGADGLSSSAYGPEEAYLALGDHFFLALPLAILMAVTVFVISASYSHIIELFPTGGGGYLVATKLLGPKVGLTSGCALIVDYMLTVTISVASAGDQIFSFLPISLHGAKLVIEFVLIFFLIYLNLRGTKESVLFLLPIFLLFVVAHIFAISLGVLPKAAEIPLVASMTYQKTIGDIQGLGVWTTIFLVLHAYSLGGGTYTGIEAVSNGLQALREPRVETGKKTMLYMASSLAFTASGLLLSYLLNHVSHEPGKTLNA